MDSKDDFTNEEFERFTMRMNAYKSDPNSLNPEVYEKCRALHEEILKDAKGVAKMISEGMNIDEVHVENKIRADLVDWISKTP